MSAVGVRRFEAEDRTALRDISYRTGLMGESVESFWRHKESWADLWTSYYTDPIRSRVSRSACVLY